MCNSDALNDYTENKLSLLHRVSSLCSLAATLVMGNDLYILYICVVYNSIYIDGKKKKKGGVNFIA